ncbi:MAG: hypothetical protein K1X54_00520 [Flavobacteriales bacterium]|nr:hypothetical protein [Flavobacteriales bacterium]
MKSIVVVLINYFKEAELCAFVNEQLLGQKGVVLHVVVVDNGSHQPALLQGLVQSVVEVIHPSKNLGYFGAAELAWKKVLERNLNPDYFVVSNFDLAFNREHFFETFLQAEARNPSLLSGPAITSELSGAALNPMYRNRLPLSRIKRLLWVTSFYPFFFIYQLLHHLKRSFMSKQVVRKEGDELAYAVHGSMMFFSRSFFEKGGHLQFDSFLYGEELFAAEQIHRLRAHAVVHHELHVTHEEHSTTGNIKGPKHMAYLHQSLKYIRREFYS